MHPEQSTRLSSSHCPYFGRCGGCILQHVPYDVQVKNKAEHVRAVLLKAGADIPLQVFSGEPFGYRNRMDFVFHDAGLGLREREKWWLIIDVENCPIAHERINHLLQESRGRFPRIDIFDIRKQVGTLKYCLIRCSRQGTGSLSFVMNEDSPRIAEQVALVKDFAKKSSADHVLVTYVPRKSEVSVSDDYFCVKGDGMLSEIVLGKTLKYSAQGFFQNNPSMAEDMVSYVRDLCNQNSGKQLFDIFGGVGLFGVCLGDLFKQVFIVESFKESVVLAQDNLKNNGIAGRAVCLDAAQLKKLDIPEGSSVIVDPPRTGIPDKAWAYLLEKKPEVIIYISCNPEQLAKELRHVLHAYHVEKGAIFDMFPQTNHVETVLKLVRKETTLA